MKTSILFLVVGLASSSMALPYNTLEKRTISLQAVHNSIKQWTSDVDTVNKYLDNPCLDPTVALAAAQNEPNQLQILSGVSGLDTDGQSAATLLAEVFGNVVNALQDIANDPTGPNVPLDLQEINNTRCLNALPAASRLWASAARAVGDVVPPPAAIPAACSTVSG